MTQLKRVLSLIARRWFFLALLGLVLLAPTAPPVKADSFFGIASPYYFSIARWEVQNLTQKWQTQLFGVGMVARASAADRIGTVREYFRLAARAGEIQRHLNQYKAQGLSTDNPEVLAAGGELSKINEQRAFMSGNVESIIQDQISEVVKREGIDLEWNFPAARFYLPPVSFTMTPLPRVLIISPRNKIEITDSLLLNPQLTDAQIDQLEREEEKLGYSAVVDYIGGVATYPAMVTDAANLEFTVETAAHEWVHHYLFLRPLGRTYGNDYTMLTLNETTADIVGREIAGAVLKDYGVVREKSQAKRPPPAQDSGFNFNKEMRQIRLTVDDYLAKGEIDQAEAFMTERRQFLADHGYHIRKLNQAYLAFHGSYSDSPASSSPIASELQDLRLRYPTLGQFIRAVSGVSDYSEFQGLLH